MSRKLKLPVEDIVVLENRQRKDFGDIDELADSIKRIGLIHPLVIRDEDNALIAGERRLRALKQLGVTEVPVRWLSQLSTDDVELIELEENVKRVNLSWQEEVEAVKRFYAKLKQVNPELTGAQLAAHIGYKEQHLYRIIRVADNLGDEKVAAAGGLAAADNVVRRQVKRAVDTAISQIDDLLDLPKSEEKKERLNLVTSTDFVSWAESYKGRPFNFLHCDFPYGIGHHETDQGHSATWGSYEDSPETYWLLVETLLKHRSKILFDSSHVLFWFSMNYYQQTIDKFTQAGFAVNPFPVIWHKNDNRGILPDPKRGPRRVYETALIMSLGDRNIIEAVSNVYAGPTEKKIHISEKPVAMLEHFFRMFVDSHTEMLDPTAGSGNALVAALRKQATRVEGLELNPEYAEAANLNINAEIRNA